MKHFQRADLKFEDIYTSTPRTWGVFGILLGFAAAAFFLVGRVQQGDLNEFHGKTPRDIGSTWLPLGGPCTKSLWLLLGWISTTNTSTQERTVVLIASTHWSINLSKVRHIIEHTTMNVGASNLFQDLYICIICFLCHHSVLVSMSLPTKCHPNIDHLQPNNSSGVSQLRHDLMATKSLHVV